ncbi:hypothetical protein BU24DRAFT_487418 [Aaosphaeria arxii CBS 175.79]|uniref:BZIP domain-containing protein n=1 Tax=Aaosphaeria arxii CBS 175.79 TaxID=1450172 RepID=A0A6A5Y8K1_9PLEO|nr:uncharacterized protein BU24DRAFT_487418 [Aaosphaeria arxii CBS 175.79]KAF2020894.1 hypothetical protein BU24DRAFT_487418 [Aaosphaeria arxii CBS 175.79]
MPAERQKKTTPQKVPGAGDPDRKRVLNVLAQRRYRQRRRERIAELEAKLNSTNSDTIRSNEISHADDLPDQCTLLPNAGQDAFDIEEIVRSIDIDVSLGPLDPGDIAFTQSFDMTTLTTTQNPPTYLPDLLPSSTSPSSSSSTSPTPPLNFPLTPDAFHLNVPILSAIRASSTIATVLGVSNHIWDPTYMHTLTTIPDPSTPSNLHPTTSQMTIPHHPVLDILPWPSVREKLICILALPSALRPQVAREDDGGDGQSKAVFQLIQDADDMNEGCRVHATLLGWDGPNEMEEEAWELGEMFFRNWWWCFDGRVLASTNRKRRERGLLPLRVGG